MIECARVAAVTILDRNVVFPLWRGANFVSKVGWRSLQGICTSQV